MSSCLDRNSIFLADFLFPFCEWGDSVGEWFSCFRFPVFQKRAGDWWTPLPLCRASEIAARARGHPRVATRYGVVPQAEALRGRRRPPVLIEFHFPSGIPISIFRWRASGMNQWHSGFPSCRFPFFQMRAGDWWTLPPLRRASECPGPAHVPTRRWVPWRG